jgi:hypothetical protein
MPTTKGGIVMKTPTQAAVADGNTGQIATASRTQQGDTVWRFVPLTSLTIGTLGLLTWLSTHDEKLTEVLPVVAIGGVVVLIALLTVVTMTFSSMGLAHRDQPLGLPEGSVRAVIALSLIVLFAIFTIFLYRGAFVGGPKSTIRLSETEMVQFFKRATLREIRSSPVMNDKGNQDTNSDGALLYDVEFRENETEPSADFAKQVFVLLGTLMTAITSFYLGNSAIPRSSAATRAAESPPRIASAQRPPTGEPVIPPATPG